MGLLGFKKHKQTTGCIDEKHINKIVDYTCILPTLTKKELEKKLCVAYKNKYYSVCVNPVNVKDAKDYCEFKLKGTVKVVCQVGFPLGENTTEAKVFELKKAISDGADEVDVMVSVSRVKMGEWGYVKNELSRLVKAAKKHTVKAIIETSVLTKAELYKICSICVKARVDYVQTSSGFAGGGAEIETIGQIVEATGGKCKVKASGGIENTTQAIIMMRAGADRIGTSREI